MTSSHRLVGFAVLLAAARCSAVGEDRSTCTVGGIPHAAGETFPAPDGCNTCTCGLDGVQCTLRGCESDLPDGGPDAGPDAGSTCEDGEKVYQPGDHFLSADGCSRCECTVIGTLACIEGPEYTHSSVCRLDATYTFSWTGGAVAYVDTATLTPPAGFAYSRSPIGGTTASASCMPAIPYCRTTGPIDVCDIMGYLADADVQRALSLTEPPFYGVDSRPAGGGAFELRRSTGGSFLIGGNCTSASPPSCVPIPAGIANLVSQLETLDYQQLKYPSCASLRP